MTRLWTFVIYGRDVIVSDGRTPDPSSSDSVGFVVVRRWVIAVLGQYFANVIEIQQDQKIAPSGPYHVIRQPSREATPLIQRGDAVAFRAWGAVLVAVRGLRLAYGKRMLPEERFLERKLGGSYADYEERTERVLPHLI